MGLSMKVHHFRKEKDPRNPAATIVRLVKSDPYARFSMEGKYVFVQGGKVYHADGVEIKDVPDWAMEQIKALTPEAQRECGADKFLSSLSGGSKKSSREINPKGLGPSKTGRPTTGLIG